MASNELSRSTLLRKDRDELVTIAEAMGAKPGSRMRKAQVVDHILELAGVGDDADPVDGETDGDAGGGKSTGKDATGGETSGGEASGEDATGGEVGADGNRAAEGADDGGDADSDDNDDRDGNKGPKDDDADDGGNRRRRRRRGRDRDNEQHDSDPVAVDGYLDLRDDGYGFIRVDGAQPTKRDVYVSVKQVRQNGLRKGDHVTGQARPANRNEKNPALVELGDINGGTAETARERRRFDDLTPVHPHERFVLERGDDPTSRVLDLLAPMGKGQRVLVVAPPRSGRTALLTSIARSIEQNHSEATVMVVLIDERPEEVTAVDNALERAEVVSSPVDRPADEHTMVADMAIERAKRMVEAGDDVVVVFDGLTRLARAHNLAGSGGRTIAGGIEAAALFHPKRFLGSARCLEEGGSLTVVATVTADTHARLDELLVEELRGSANTEIHLDRTLAEARIFPAIDVATTSTLHDDVLVDDATREKVTALRREVSDDHDGGIGALLERLASHPTNAELLG